MAPDRRDHPPRHVSDTEPVRSRSTDSLAVFRRPPGRAAVYDDPNPPVFMTHIEFEVKRPAYERYARGGEAHRKANYLKSGGDPERYTPARDFPCRGLLVLVDRNGPIWTAACTQCNFEVTLKRGAIDRDYMIRHRVELAELPDKFVGKKFEATPGTDAARSLLVAMLDRWPDQEPSERRGPFLHGPNGVGKTHMLVAATATLIRRHMITARYLPADAFAATLRNAVRAGDGSADDMVSDLAEHPDLLVLDDLGATYTTEWLADRIQQLVDLRYAWSKPLIGATNVPLSTWPEAFGARAASRLSGLCSPVDVTGDDWRQRAPDPDDEDPGY